MTLAAALEQFDRRPASYVRPERLQACLPVPLSAETCRRLVDCKRVSDRLSAVMCGRLDLPRLSLADFALPDRRLALLDQEGLQRAVRLAGAVWHAAGLRTIIRSKILSEIVASIGEDCYRFAMRHVELSIVDPAEARPADLPAALDLDGGRCLSAWYRQLPPSLAARARLKIPAAIDIDAEPPRLHRVHGPPIMVRVVETLCAFGDDADAAGRR